MHVLEKNGFDYKDTFELEVFIYDHDGTQNRCSPCNNSNEEYTLKKLSFLMSNKTIENDLLKDSAVFQEFPIEFDLLSDVTNDNVEYFLDISADGEIQRNEVCQALNQYKAKTSNSNVSL